MQMSKELAKKIAVKLTEKKEKEVEKAQDAYNKYVTDTYISHTPKEILRAAKKFPEWINSDLYITINGFGFNHEQVKSTTRVIKNTSYSAVLILNHEIAKTAKQFQNKVIDLKKELKQLQLEIETALFGLRSFKKIEEHLPEAVKYLPKSSSVELMVNFDDLRQKIKTA